MNKTRYYEGRVKVLKISETTAMKTAMYELLEDGLLGNKTFGFKDGKKGEIILAPVRRCFKERK